jgi:hypothetical protein
MEHVHFAKIALLILLTRLIPRGIFGVVLISLVLSYILVGKSDITSMFIVFIIPIFLSLLLTPECITSRTHRNREYYGSTFNMCKFIQTKTEYVTYARIFGELMIIGSFIAIGSKYSLLRNIIYIIAITLITTEMMFFHPVPLMENEYRTWIL